MKKLPLLLFCITGIHCNHTIPGQQAGKAIANRDSMAGQKTKITNDSHYHHAISPPAASLL
ncbi:hypothetical protein [Chitinophaga polysaccharea]|uniref:hypothetical protein n=1 Tax=Chitinophaga polysaccharea TaxID=1293035 RepID=UPI0011A6B0BE|nr:hypothetical protein [Chitinophaga polysaccharea]